LNPSSTANLRTLRWRAFGIVGLSFMLSFFHRTAPAALSGELSQTFAISGAALGTLAATYFYVYTVLQIPVGVWADTLGPRRIVTLGALVTAAGSLLFGLAPTWGIAAAGRTLVGLGVSVTFIALLKLTAAWFPGRQFATLNGLTLLLGNLGAVASAAPLAMLASTVSWRHIFVGLGAMSALLAVLTWWLVRNRPEDCGLPPVNPGLDNRPTENWRAGLLQVLRNRRTWPGFWVNLGIAGSFLSFAGLWAVPFLRDVYGMDRVTAANHTSILLLGVAFGAVICGALSDRLRNRRGVLLAYAALYTLSWLPWLMQTRLPLWGTYGCFLLMGLLIPGFILTWPIAKEVNAPALSGMATSVVNTGIFLGAGILQPLVGWALDRGRIAGDLPAAYGHGIGVLAGFTAFGFLAGLFLTETRGSHSADNP
jgi:sugar phosphate permease